MSFSMSMRAASVAALMALATQRFDDEVVAQQPGHKADRDLVLKTIEGAASVVTLPEDKDVSLSVSGSIGGYYQNDGSYNPITSSNITVSVSVVERPTSGS